MSSEDNIETLRGAMEAFNRRDFDAALTTVSDDIRWERFLSRTESGTAAVNGKDELRAAWESQVEAVDLSTEVEEYIPIGEDKVAVVMQMVAHGSASEITLRIPATWVWAFDDRGLIFEVRTYDTREDALRDTKPD
ncbi:MAG: nuclear transport factor 2 family protein [Solirubrobacterales bacterium]